MKEEKKCVKLDCERSSGDLLAPAEAAAAAALQMELIVAAEARSEKVLAEIALNEGGKRVKR